MSNDRTDPSVKADDIEAIYRELRRGVGHELVNDANVFKLIDRAERDGHRVLAQELREWQSPCADGASEVRRPIVAPTAGFNREHRKH